VEAPNQERVVALAAALCGDASVAAELLGGLPAAADHQDLHGDDDLAPAQRASLVQRYLRLRRRSTPATGAPAEAPVEEVATTTPSPDGLAPTDGAPTPDGASSRHQTLEPVAAAVAALAPLPRAVLVLHHLEHVTLAEIAQITERGFPAVRRALDDAELAVVAEPWAVEQVLAAAPRPEPWQVQAAAQAASRVRQRVRGRILVAGMVTAALLVAGAVLPGLLQPDPYTRGLGEWVYSVTVPDEAAFEVTGRSLTPTEEVLAVERDGSTDGSCSVTVTTAEQEGPVPDGHATTVGRRPARFLETTELWWSLGARTSAVAECEEPVEDEVLLELARLVRSGPLPVLLPFRLPVLPDGRSVTRVYDYERFHGATIAAAGDEEDSSGAVLVTVPTFFPLPEDRRLRTVDVNGSLGTVVRDNDGQWLCWRVSGERACVGSFNQAQRPPDSGRQLDRLTAVARTVRIASDLSDRATWFDARAALPR